MLFHKLQVNSFLEINWCLPLEPCFLPCSLPCFLCFRVFAGNPSPHPRCYLLTCHPNNSFSLCPLKGDDLIWSSGGRIKTEDREGGRDRVQNPRTTTRLLIYRGMSTPLGIPPPPRNPDPTSTWHPHWEAATRNKQRHCFSSYICDVSMPDIPI